MRVRIGKGEGGMCGEGVYREGGGGMCGEGERGRGYVW